MWIQEEESVVIFLGRVGLGFELRASHLQSRHSTALVIPPVHFAQIILRWGLVNYLAGMVSNCNSPKLSLPSS
jgi:hypothetical protein